MTTLLVREIRPGDGVGLLNADDLVKFDRYSVGLGYHTVGIWCQVGADDNVRAHEVQVVIPWEFSWELPQPGDTLVLEPVDVKHHHDRPMWLSHLVRVLCRLERCYKQERESAVVEYLRGDGTRLVHLDKQALDAIRDEGGVR